MVFVSPGMRNGCSCMSSLSLDFLSVSFDIFRFVNCVICHLCGLIFGSCKYTLGAAQPELCILRPGACVLSLSFAVTLIFVVLALAAPLRDDIRSPEPSQMLSSKTITTKVVLWTFMLEAGECFLALDTSDTTSGPSFPIQKKAVNKPACFCVAKRAQETKMNHVLRIEDRNRLENQRKHIPSPGQPGQQSPLESELRVRHSGLLGLKERHATSWALLSDAKGVVLVWLVPLVWHELWMQAVWPSGLRPGADCS